MGSVIQVIIITLFIFLMVAFIILFMMLYQKRHTKYIEEKQLLQAKFQQEILQAQIEIQEQTLQHISQEIHDNIGQVMSVVKLNLNTLHFIGSEPAQCKLESSRQLVGKVIADLRDLARSMHGDRIAEMGLKNAIEHELDILRKTGIYQTELVVTGEHYQLDQQKEIILFRLLQEALNNTIKHSQATTIGVSLNYTSEKFSMRIKDEGIGFDIDHLALSTMGLGLKSMQNRAVLIGGTFSLNSAPRHGTAITIDISRPMLSIGIPQ